MNTTRPPPGGIIPRGGFAAQTSTLSRGAKNGKQIRSQERDADVRKHDV
jgi:hypothetical protein